MSNIIKPASKRLYKRGVVDCKRGIKSRSSNNSYLSGYGRQYEREQITSAMSSLK